MKSEKSKKILAFVLCMVLMLTTSMSTMAQTCICFCPLCQSLHT